MKDEVKGIIGSGITWLTTISQTNEIFELVQIILASVTSLATLAYIIYKWYKKATDKNSDGGSSITKGELKDLGKQITKFKEDENHGDNS